jgi:hypothetical protein
MRNWSSFYLSLAAAALFVSHPAYAAQHDKVHARAAHVRLAPADEYFGRQKMSILEVGNRLRDMTRRLHDNGASAQDIMHTALMTDDAMRDWQRKYPADPWLRKDRAALSHIYAAARLLGH